MNLGQMFKDVRLAIGQNAKTSLIARPPGAWLTEEEIIKTIDEIFEGKYATSI